MDLHFTPAEEDFRDRVRTWLAEHVPRRSDSRQGPAMRQADLAWQRTLYDGGWAGISWPAQYGGLGLSRNEEMIWYEEYARAGAPSVGTCFVGLNHAGPTLIARANEEQKAFHLPRILRGEVVWCQGFSEPDAGSDLASLTTRAVVDGEDLVVTGHKVWTSYAHLADYQELLVRTDSTAPKHSGITWVICDMRSPGIDVRTIETLHGQEHFCEVFYDAVRIPVTNIVGELNDGWRVAMSTLSFERGTAFLAAQIELAQRVEELIDTARQNTGPDGRRPAIADDEIARRLAAARAEVASLRAMTYATVSRIAKQSEPGPEASMVRLHFSLVTQSVYRLAMDLLGPRSLHMDENDRVGQWSWGYLDSFRGTIAAGTKDIQRNIIGERVLHLPRS
jgi:alkylation response protein AidB-like acyl-CoA dehydrogenase